MTKEEQKKFILDVLDMLHNGGVTLKWFLAKLGVSRTHWFFLKNGERVLTDENKNKIISILQDKLLYESN